MMRAAAIALLSLLLVAPAAADDIKDLDAAWSKAMKEGDIAAVLALYDEEAVFFAADVQALKGSRAIGEYYAGFLSQFRVKDVRFMDAEAETEDDLSVGWGRYAMVLEPKAGGAEQKVEGRFTAIARKKDGKWRYVVDHASAALPAPPPKSPVE